MAGVVFAGPLPPEALQDLRWRLLGPLRAGWSTCAEGVPEEPDTFYFGAADGGVWRTTDAGITWGALADTAPFSSVETLAIASGSPRTIYVGSGQVTTRYDVMDGTGVYKTEDEGRTWTSLGLTDTRHIGRILIDPRDPKLILVAALGHMFGPNPERGVFRSADGGTTWEKVLFVNEDTGAVDLASDPATPDIIYAALWQVRLHPWQSYFMTDNGPGSGIWKSTDAGKTWSQTSRKGLPDGPLSRIGLAVAPGTNGQRIYASVRAAVDSGFYRSDDGGASWQLTNGDDALASTYFGRVTADPKNNNAIYVIGVAVHRSEDGGKTFDIIKGTPGGDDYHFLWINPAHPDHMIVTSDQGSAVTVNGGKTWSPWYNQATGQFYRLAADDRFPYWVYSGQQDSGTVGVATRSDYGQLTFRDWHPVGGDERDYDIPDPEDPNIVYGSGLGGRLSKWDANNGRVSNISPWPFSSYALRPTTIKYRYSWITPFAISLRPSHALYQGAQVLFRSLDKGHSWQIISPDLSGADPNAKNCDGDIPVSRATSCGYGVIWSIAPSRLADGLLWIGTDNGRIQITRDDGEHWTNVTPAAIEDWSKIAMIEPSPSDPTTAYVAVDRHRLDDLRPYIYRTHDYGQTWISISNGIPADSWVNVVRQDPKLSGLLYAGTRTGAFVSFDDGDHWQPLQLNLPRTGVNDLLVHDKDLIAATQGRALWVLDDVTPLRQIDADTVTTQPVLVQPSAAVRLSPNENRDTPLPPEMPTTPNPPTGAVIDYFLHRVPASLVVLEILDEKGVIVRAFRSDDKPERTNAEHEFAELWLQPLPVLPARIGHNRFVWDLLYDRPKAPQYGYSIAAVPGLDTPALPQGMPVLPGRYSARLVVDGKPLLQSFTVERDPRSSATIEDLRAQLVFYREVTSALAGYTEKYQKVKALDINLERITSGKVKPKSQKELRSAQEQRKQLARFVAAVDALDALAVDLEQADGPPTVPQHALYEESVSFLQTARVPPE
jgi:photosystem II stability/assembly factor-like uncharacterized protein